jgi:hypothetical protein
MNAPALRSGDTVWRIGRAGPLRCVYLRPVPGALVEVRASTFSRNTTAVNADDVFANRDACRAEIQRRAQLKEQAS